MGAGCEHLLLCWLSLDTEVRDKNTIRGVLAGLWADLIKPRRWLLVSIGFENSRSGLLRSLQECLRDERVLSLLEAHRLCLGHQE